MGVCSTYIDYQNDEYTSMYSEISADDRSALSKIKNIPGFPCSFESGNALLRIFDETHSTVTITEYNDGSAIYSILGIVFQNYVNELQDYVYVLDESYREPEFISKYAKEQSVYTYAKTSQRHIVNLPMISLLHSEKYSQRSAYCGRMIPRL